MVHREQVAEERGRRWINGTLPSDDYFRGARRQAREQARKVVADRLRRIDREAVPATR
jgi:hypothetical protein